MSAVNHSAGIARRFGAAAGTYHDRALVQARVAGRLMQFLPASVAGRNILEIGCGTGLLTRLLVERFPTSMIDALDVADTMVAEARRRLKMFPQIHWHTSDALHFPCSKKYDLVISNCSLHWMPALDDALAHLRSCLELGGYLAFSLILDGTLPELHECRLRVASDKKPQGRLPTFEETRQHLLQSGCSILLEREDTETESFASASDFLSSIHDRGLTAGAVSRSAMPLNRKELRELAEEYNRRYQSDGHGVVATYKVGYFIVVSS